LVDEKDDQIRDLDEAELGRVSEEPDESPLIPTDEKPDNVVDFNRPEVEGVPSHQEFHEPGGAGSIEVTELPCGMCLTPKALEVLVPICAQCAQKLQGYTNNILNAMNGIIGLLYPRHGVPVKDQ
jgi:hypothetical protein